MRPDANSIALRAVRKYLDGAAPLDLVVAGTRVTCAVRRGAAVRPPRELAGLSAVDDPWPARVEVDCTWAGGRCTLTAQADYFRGSKAYKDDVGLSTYTGRQELVWSNVRRGVGDTPDGDTFALRARAMTFKRRRSAEDDLGRRLNDALRELLGESGLPITTATTVELCSFVVPAGDVVGDATKAFERVVHLALLKLDFLDRSPEALQRQPIVDLKRWDLDRAEIAEIDADEDTETEPAPSAPRRYWAGGFDDKQKLDEFRNGNYWRVFYKRDDARRPARNAWKNLEEVRPGDWFAIKGLGGEHDLKIRYVGEVTDVDLATGKVNLSRLDVPLYSGKGPMGRGAGNWHETLVAVTRPDIIEQIFGVSDDDAAVEVAADPAAELPLNVIFYGPPGTGKTYHLRRDLMPMFTRRTTSAVDTGDDLTWWEAIAVAMKQLGGKATVDQLVGHPLLMAKYAAQPVRAELRQRLWSTLGHHTVATSSVVKTKRRFGDLLFDKQADGTWYLAEDLPEHLVERARHVGQRGAASASHDYAFVTFHQAYSYEDFVEGIRPELGGDEAEEATLGYRLADGIFLKAARAALGLTEFRGSLEAFCELSPTERRRYLEGAPRYALFVDEINRGNVARILGELITLLEDDKRLGESNELIVTLPYSQRRFGVPSNLHVIGTMNTADRSVEALDAALRRRFAFRELAPRPDMLPDDIDGVDLRKLLRTINLRLEVLAGRDHAIGHAYFLDLGEDPSIEDIKRVFELKLIPLLQEYFFGDWGKIGLVLGRDFVVRREHVHVALADFDHPNRDALGERPTWELQAIDKLTSLSFRAVYDPHAAD